MGRLPKGGKARARASAKLNRIKHEQALIRHKRLLAGILKWDAQDLKRLCSPVEKDEDLSFIKRLKATLAVTDNGLGLAAPQIGILKNVFAYRKSTDSTIVNVMINPLIVGSSEKKATSSEGCLSFPGVVAQVERYTSVTVNWKDENWNDKTGTFTKLESVVVQHEIDHLFGICKIGEAWLQSKVELTKTTDTGFGVEEHPSEPQPDAVESLPA
jgi:peptide deformylase